MATFSWSMSVIKRSEGRSIVAAAAYYARETLHDDRTGKSHDYRDRGDLVHSEIMLPDDAPEWCQSLNREKLWNQVEAVEKRKDAQLGRALRVMIPRELSAEDRIQVVRDYVRSSYTSRGMIADVSWHCPPASTGGDNPHAHILLTLRTLGPSNFGPKSRHDMVPDPEGRMQPDGRPLLVPSNDKSWNTVEFFQETRAIWERVANDALQRMGSTERIDARSLLARGLARLPEPALRLAFHLKDLSGVMVERWGQFVAAKHYKHVEQRAKAAFRTMDAELPVAATVGRSTEARPQARRDETPAHRAERFFGWIERQITRLATVAPALLPGHRNGAPAAERAPLRQPPTPGMER